MTNAEIVRDWFRRFNGGPLARATEAWNQVGAALPALIEALDGAAPPAPIAVAEPPIAPAPEPAPPAEPADEPTAPDAA